MLVLVTIVVLMLGFGGCLLHGLLGLLVGRQHHRHRSSFETGLRVDLGCRAHRFEHVVEDLRPQFGVCHLSTTELQRDLDLVALFDESDDVACLGVEVAPADLRPVLDFLHRHVGRLLPRFLGLLALFVLELAVIHDPANGRVGVGRHFDEVEFEASGHPQRIGDRLDSELVAGGSDETDFTGSDAVVDAMLIATLFWSRCYDCSLLCNGPPHVSDVLALDANRTRSDRHTHHRPCRRCRVAVSAL